LLSPNPVLTPSSPPLAPLGAPRLHRSFHFLLLSLPPYSLVTRSAACHTELPNTVALSSFGLLLPCSNYTSKPRGSPLLQAPSSLCAAPGHSPSSTGGYAGRPRLAAPRPAFPVTLRLLHRERELLLACVHPHRSPTRCGG